jgi:hypothetical protein
VQQRQPSDYASQALNFVFEPPSLLLIFRLAGTGSTHLFLRQVESVVFSFQLGFAGFRS